MSSSRARRHLKSVYKLVLRNLFPITAFPIAAASTVVFVAASFGPPYEVVRALHPAHLFLASFLPAAAIIYYYLLWHWQTRKVYLVDYACFRGSHQNRIPSASLLEHMRQIPSFSERSVRFLTRLLPSSGLGEETCLPPSGAYLSLHEECTLQASREEAEDVVFSAIDDLLAKTGAAPESIDILVSNCSAFNPTPSFPDMIVNRYKMRSDIRNVHLSGMGCSAGLVASELARNLLLASPAPGRALVVSTETLTPNYYFGNERAMLLPYCLFRVGGAAVLLSTSPANARFRLGHAVRTLTAADDRSYHCIFQEEDGKGNRGANLSKDLPRVAASTLKANITAIAPLVLPASEKLRFALSFVSGKLFNGGGTVRVKLRVPDMKAAFEHFCIHAGGRAVIDEVQRSLGLSDVHVEPSRMTLHRFGNTSSSSTWYELAYIEAKDRMHVGDRVWMIGFGSGFKCASVVLHCIAAPDREVNSGPWAKCIQRYPVRIFKPFHDSRNNSTSWID